MKSCTNCRNRMYHSWFGLEPCGGWEMTESEQEEREMASTCHNYEKETEEDREERRGHYHTSSTNRDYSPSNPWDAPGMSVNMFI